MCRVVLSPDQIENIVDVIAVISTNFADWFKHTSWNHIKGHILSFERFQDFHQSMYYTWWCKEFTTTFSSCKHRKTIFIGTAQDIFFTAVASPPGCWWTGSTTSPSSACPAPDVKFLGKISSNAYFLFSMARMKHHELPFRSEYVLLLQSAPTWSWQAKRYSQKYIRRYPPQIHRLLTAPLYLSSNLSIYTSKSIPEQRSYILMQIHTANEARRLHPYFFKPMSLAFCLPF